MRPRLAQIPYLPSEHRSIVAFLLLFILPIKLFISYGNKLWPFSSFLPLGLVEVISAYLLGLLLFSLSNFSQKGVNGLATSDP